MSGPKPALSAKRERFCQEVIIDSNAKQAAIRAGYSAKTAEQQGCMLLQTASVARRVAELREELSQRLDLSAERVLREAARVSFSDPRKLFNADGTLKAITELDDDTAAALAGFEVVERAMPGGEGRTERVHKFKLWDKPTAISLLGKHLNLFTDRIDIGEELAAVLDRARARRQTRLA